MAGSSTLRKLALIALPLAGALALPFTTKGKRQSSWKVANSYKGDSFFDGFNYFTDADPTHGSVTFVQDSSLAYVDGGGNAIMKVDNTTDVASGSPRKSVRIGSKDTLSEGSLVIMTGDHFPFGCAVWGAFWLVGPSWPSGGEVDIFEGVNKNTQNQATLHTSPGCKHDSGATESGTVLQDDCDTNVNGNAGCGVQDPSTNSYGTGLNNAGGGTFATLWDSNGFQIWFWNAGSEPSDATGDSPNPSGWGDPLGSWPFTTCKSSFFNDLQIVFDITLCGDWAGQDQVYQLTCPGSGTCADQVATGSNFNEAYFSVKSVTTFTSS